MKINATRSVFRSLVLGGMFALCSANVFAQTMPTGGLLGGAAYTIYTGDVNGDGLVDLLAKAKLTLVVIPFEPDIPIPVRPPSATFVLLSNGGSYTLDPAPSSATLTNSAWQSGGYQLLYGDFAGNGTAGMLIRATTAGGTTFSITNSGSGPQLLQAMTGSSLGVDLGASNSVTELADQNGDGRADLLVRTGGRVTAVLLANSNGLFSRSDGDPVVAAWFGMLNALTAGNQADALQYVTYSIRDVYQQAFSNMGTATTVLRSTLSNLAAVQVTDRFATYVVDQNTDGAVRMHFIQFVNLDGTWMLDSF